MDTPVCRRRFLSRQPRIVADGCTALASAGAQCRLPGAQCDATFMLATAAVDSRRKNTALCVVSPAAAELIQDAGGFVATKKRLDRLVIKTGVLCALPVKSSVVDSSIVYLNVRVCSRIFLINQTHFANSKLTHSQFL